MLFFLEHSKIENLRIMMHADVRVGDDDQEPVALVYLCLHFIKIFFGES